MLRLFRVLKRLVMVDLRDRILPSVSVEEGQTVVRIGRLGRLLYASGYEAVVNWMAVCCAIAIVTCVTLWIVLLFCLGNSHNDPTTSELIGMAPIAGSAMIASWLAWFFFFTLDEYLKIDEMRKCDIYTAHFPRGTVIVFDDVRRRRKIVSQYSDIHLWRWRMTGRYQTYEWGSRSTYVECDPLVWGSRLAIKPTINTDLYVSVRRAVRLGIRSMDDLAKKVEAACLNAYAEWADGFFACEAPFATTPAELNGDLGRYVQQRLVQEFEGIRIVADAKVEFCTTKQTVCA